MSVAFMFIAKHWRAIGLIALIIAIWCAGLYIKSVFDERDDPRSVNAHLTKELTTAARMQEFTDQVAEAISQIKTRSQQNVAKIEGAKKPQFIDGDPVLLIPGGLLKPWSMYSSAVAPRPAPGNATGGPLAAGKPAR